MKISLPGSQKSLGYEKVENLSGSSCGLYVTSHIVGGG